ncbi:MAG: hypothetical protein LBT42_02635, partial [Tannerella sp.]|nr:hypothetical protein [Tannerella sp.]
MAAVTVIARNEAIQRKIGRWIASFLAMTTSAAVSLRHFSCLLNLFSDFLAMTASADSKRSESLSHSSCSPDSFGNFLAMTECGASS